MHCHLDEMEVSFWNSEDRRIDSIFSSLDEECTDIIKREIILGKSNYDLAPEELKSLGNEYQYRDEPIPLELPMEDRINPAAMRLVNLTIPHNDEVATEGVAQNGERNITIDDIFPDWVINHT